MSESKDSKEMTAQEICDHLNKYSAPNKIWIVDEAAPLAQKAWDELIKDYRSAHKLELRKPMSLKDVCAYLGIEKENHKEPKI